MRMFNSTAVSRGFRRSAHDRAGLALLLAFAALLQVTAPARAAQQPAQLPRGDALRLCVELKCRKYQCPTVRCNLIPYNHCVERCKNGG